LNKLKKQANDKGYVETIFGRRRPTPDVKSPNFIVRQAALRQAINMPMQGTEADLMKMAMVKLERAFESKFGDRRLKIGDKSRTPNSQLPTTDDAPHQLLQVHDSILVECPADKADDIAKILKDTMINVYPELGIALSVDIHIGKNWGEL